MLGEGLVQAGRDSGLTLHLHDFNDWVQRSLIELTADIQSAFFVASEAKASATPATDTKAVATQSQTQGQNQGQQQS